MADIIIQLLSLFSTIFYLLVLARIVMSFIQVDRYHPVVNLIYQLTEPILAPIRNILPQVGMFDFSPMVAIILVELFVRVLATLVKSLF
ncbi:MAG: YggT family protein [Chloroflexota bacterium]|jgi:YggT family protein|nr:YggT family protein [Anaerolineales bacterium]